MIKLLKSSTSKDRPDYAWINPAAISHIIEDDGIEYTEVYMLGQSEPIEAMETAADILEAAGLDVTEVST